MRLVQITDCHLFADVNKLGYKQINPYQTLKIILKEVSGYKPDLLLVTGDVSGDGSIGSYQHFKQLISNANLRCGITILPGNHDSPELLKSEFPQNVLWGNSPLISDEKEWQIHLLNSHYKSTFGQVSVQDLLVLSEQLDRNPEKAHLIAVHHHPLDCGGWMDKHPWLNRHEFVELINQHSAVKAVVYGHIHSDIESTKNGIQYMACPSTCWQWQNSELFAVSELRPGFRVINLLENGQISTSVKRIL
ncbi:metallophosphoesterase [Paraglaciecola aquimarina]|uniref:Metallophosphoesterase n=1 Tax=Paraglaciecola algarum TaxID=3050085 RepID=A0ABS9D7X8_9ALTE|nr:metallophosphoesterase [Paraglaciecola sp. G1-23]MCF2949077.1 metallophosphoesterase [Paraglaciecola sp. G1-23]